MDIGSKQVAAAAIKMALTADREEEHRMRQLLAEEGFRTAAVDFGGDFITSIKKVIERAMVAATREGVISERHLEQGALAGAAREAVAQIMNKAVSYTHLFEFLLLFALFSSSSAGREEHIRRQRCA